MYILAAEAFALSWPVKAISMRYVLGILMLLLLPRYLEDDHLLAVDWAAMYSQ